MDDISILDAFKKRLDEDGASFFSWYKVDPMTDHTPWIFYAEGDKTEKVAMLPKGRGVLFMAYLKEDEL